MTWTIPNHPIPNTTSSTSQLWTSTDWAYNRMKSALEEIIEILGPTTTECSANECEGCAYEMAEAHRVAMVALGREAPRHSGPEHKKRDE